MEPMNSTERIFFRLERPGFPIDVAGIMMLESGPPGPIAHAEMRRRLGAALETTPFLRRRVSPAPLGIGEDHWVMTDDIDWDAHLHLVQCPAPGTQRELLDLVLELTADPLDRTRPLWEVHYVDGMAEGRAAVILRVHHALTDGGGLMKFFQSVFDTDAAWDPAKVGPLEDAPHEPGDSVGEYHLPDAAHSEPAALIRAVVELPERVLVNAVTGVRIARTIAVGTPHVAARLSRRVARRLTGGSPGDSALAELPRLPRLPRFIPSLTSHPPVTRFNRHVSDPSKTIAVTSLPLAEVAAARAAHPGATINDVILALTSGALRNYLEPLGEIPDRPMLTTCPVSVSANPGRESSADGNAFTAIWVELPVHLADPVDRLAAVHAGSSRAKSRLTRSRASWNLLADVGDMMLPTMVSAAMEFAGSRVFQIIPPTLNLSVSTMRGPDPLYFCGHKVDHLHVRTIICPPVHLFVHAVTYDGKVELGFLSVTQLLPDPDTMADHLRVELDALLARVAPASGAKPKAARKKAVRKKAVLGESAPSVSPRRADATKPVRSPRSRRSG